MTPIIGTDWSVYQGSRGVSAPFLKRCDKGGIRFLFNRASLASSYTDPSLVPNLTRAADLGWFVGAFHFLYAGSGAVQAESFVRSVDRLPPALIAAGIGMAVDVEWAGSNNHDDWPRWRDFVAFAKRFEELRPGQPLGLYTAPGYWGSGIIGNKDATEWADYLWLARWIDGDPIDAVTLPPNPPRPGIAGFETTDLWQWGALMVGTKVVDGDAYYGTPDELRAMATKQRVRPPIPERVNYRLGYNLTTSLIAAGVPDIVIPDGPPGPAYPAGVAAAQDDAIEALHLLEMRP